MVASLVSIHGLLSANPDSLFDELVFRLILTGQDAAIVPIWCMIMVYRVISDGRFVLFSSGGGPSCPRSYTTGMAIHIFAVFLESGRQLSPRFADIYSITVLTANLIDSPTLLRLVYFVFGVGKLDF